MIRLVLPPAMIGHCVVPMRTRRSEDELNVVIVNVMTSYGQRNLPVRGGQYWNSLHSEIKANASPESFRLAIKKYSEFND